MLFFSLYAIELNITKNLFHIHTLSFFSISSFCQNTNLLLEISKFVDGDTFWVKHSNGTEEKIRFIGIDTPEARNTGRAKVEYFGKEASEYVERLLTRKKVRL